MKHQPLRYLFVAGLGRREIGPRGPLRDAVKTELRRIAAADEDAQPVALASGAAGADQVFLEAAQELGWPLRLLLPVPRHVFESDFTSHPAGAPPQTDQAGLDAFRTLYGQAIDVEVIPPSPGRREAFARTADELVHRADVVVVLWDGQPGGIAGTNETLDLIIREKKALSLLDAQSGQPRLEHTLPTAAAIVDSVQTRQDAGILRDITDALKKAPHKDGLSALDRMAAATGHRATPHPPAASALAPASTPPLAGTSETIEAILEDVLKRGARTLSDEHREGNTLVLLLHVAATAVGLIGLAFLSSSAHGDDHAWLLAKIVVGFVALWQISRLPLGKKFCGAVTAVCAVFFGAKFAGLDHAWADDVAAFKLVLVSLAIWLIGRLQRERNHLRWSRARYVREIGRSLSRTAAVTAQLRESVGTFIPPSLWVVFRRLKLPLTTLYAAGRPDRTHLQLSAVMEDYRQAVLAQTPPPADNIGAARAGENQYRYFQRSSAQAAHRLHAVHRGVWTCLILMVVSAALALLLPWCHAPLLLLKTFKFLSVFLPVLAGALLVMPNLNDWNRRATVYRSIVERLAELDRRLVDLQTLLQQSASTGSHVPGGVALWRPEALSNSPPAVASGRPPKPTQQEAVEAMVANRFAVIVAEAEATILTELIGFKTFVESVEVG